MAPPYEGPCRRADDGAEHDEDVTGLGRYRGLCGICRPIVAAAQKAARGDTPARLADRDGMEDELRSGPRPPTLTRVCQDLARQATKLEQALDNRKSATVRAKTVLSEFKESLAIVGRVAQSLVNQSGTAPADEP